jgi:hypothetical protein
MFRFSIRSLLIVTTLIAVALAVGLHGWRMEKLARLHTREAELVAQRRATLLTTSVIPIRPHLAWEEYDRQERWHLQLASEYRQRVWRPWLSVTRPSPPLPIEVVGH